MNILLQILDDGIITDSHGKQVDFCNTIIVMTTNAGSTYATNKPGFSTDMRAMTEDKTKRALAEFLRPEFLNRVDEIITFNSLTPDDFKKIAAIMLSDLCGVIEKKGIAITFTDACRDTVAEKSYSAKYGARNMRRYIETAIEDKIAGRIVETRGEISSLTVDAENGEIVLQ